ncbi:mitochondrial fission ELM1 family protein [Guyparkeria sp. TX1]|uniref:mitochondrial fission ELM1 family protein n=1 Tax=Guyparkeria sp. TX1 TaxID=3115001 RepID=UPI0039777032
MNAVWIVSDGSPGHYNQSRAVAEAVQEARGWDVEWVTVRPRYRGSFRPLVYRMMDWFPGRLGLSAALRLFRCDRLPESPPSLVISSGGTTAVFNALVAAEFGCPNLFLGPPPLRSDHFSRVLLSEEEAVGANVFELPYLPTPVTPQVAQEAGKVLSQDLAVTDRPLWAMLIGGCSRNHRFETGDWQALAEGMSRLSRQHGGRWLITSSRRTGQPAEALLREMLGSECVAEATWWQSRPRPVIPAYLGASDVVFCTEDSLSMLTDAMAASKPVFALSPKGVAFDAGGDMVAKYLDRHQAAGRMRRMPITDLSQINPTSLRGFLPLSESIKKQIYEGYVRDLLDEPR